MQNNVETPHKHILYIGSLCNIALPMARLTCIVTFRYLWKENIYVQSSDLIRNYQSDLITEYFSFFLFNMYIYF